jgi:hypothetical protein
MFLKILSTKFNFYRYKTIYDTLYCNRYMEFNCLLSVEFIHLIGRTDLFRVGGLVFGGATIVTILHSRLEEQTA